MTSSLRLLLGATSGIDDLYFVHLSASSPAAGTLFFNSISIMRLRLFDKEVEIQWDNSKA